MHIHKDANINIDIIILRFAKLKKNHAFIVIIIFKIQVHV